MSIDDRAGDAADRLRARLDDVAIPDLATVAGAVVRRRRTSRLLAVGVVVVLGALGSLVAIDIARDDNSLEVSNGVHPPGSVTMGAWSAIPTGAAGLDDATVVTTVSEGRYALVAGQRGTDEDVVAAIWRSEDGLRWERAGPDDVDGVVTAIAANGDEALAVGRVERRDTRTSEMFIWRSEDGGRTWHETARGDIFGQDAYEMGRPSVTSLVRADNAWVASGGGSNGYGALWRSENGSTWTQVLDSRETGSISIARNTDERVLAYAHRTATGQTIGWFSSDSGTWGSPVVLETSGGLVPRDVSDDGTLAPGVPFDNVGGLATTLLHSVDDGRTWEPVPRFAESFPTAWVEGAVRVDGVWVVSGADRARRDVGEFDHEQAWASIDGRNWELLPAELRSVGWPLFFIEPIDGRFVILAGKADHYYVLEPRELMPVDPGDGNKQLEPRTVVDQGTTTGVPWYLEAYDSTSGTCIEFRYRSSSGGGCGFLEDQIIGESRVALGQGDSPAAMFGPTRLDVVAVTAILHDGESITTSTVGRDLGFGVGFFVFVGDDSNRITTLIATDESGNELGRIDVATTP